VFFLFREKSKASNFIHNHHKNIKAKKNKSNKNEIAQAKNQKAVGNLENDGRILFIEDFFALMKFDLEEVWVNYLIQFLAFFYGYDDE
jgi:hypothetical protein